MALSDIVQVNITTQATAPSRVGFGTPLVMAYHTVFPERARIYKSITAMVDDGFAPNDPAVRAVQAILSQNPKVGEVVVGRAANAPTQKINLAPVVANDTLYRVTINGVDFDFTSDATATADEITAGLALAINGGSEPVTATDNVGDLDLVTDTAGLLFTLEVDRQLLKQANTTVDPGIVADISAVQNENNDWYALHLTSLGKAEIEAAAAYIEAQVKAMIVSSADDDIYTTATTDVGSALSTANYARTALMYHPKSMIQYAGAAWAGKNLPKDPGSITWKFKTLAGVDTVQLTETEITNLENKNVNHFTSVSGISITQQGTMAGGTFIDITRSVDFLRARLQEFIYAQLANLDKIPFTDEGVAVIEAEVRAVLQLGIGQGILAANPEPVITVPRVADVSFSDKASRLLPDVEFEATLAGAIHSVQIEGVVSV